WWVMGAVAPFVLVSFLLVFGSESYQFWGDRYHYNLTNRYIYSRIPNVSPLEPLWREDVLAGNLWLVSLVVPPVSVPVLLARLFRLEPMAIDLVSALLTYFASVIGMYLFLRRIVRVARDVAAAFALLYAATSHYLSTLLGTHDLVSMATALAPVLLVLVGRCAREL